MSPRDWKFVFGIVEYVAENAYKRGRVDAAAGKSRDSKEFLVNGALQLLLKKQYSDFMKNT